MRHVKQKANRGGGAFAGQGGQTRVSMSEHQPHGLLRSNERERAGRKRPWYAELMASGLARAVEVRRVLQERLFLAFGIHDLTQVVLCTCYILLRLTEYLPPSARILTVDSCQLARTVAQEMSGAGSSLEVPYEWRGSGCAAMASGSRRTLE